LGPYETRLQPEIYQAGYKRSNEPVEGRMLKCIEQSRLQISLKGIGQIELIRGIKLLKKWLELRRRLLYVYVYRWLKIFR